MIQKLRWQFVLIIMSVVTVLLAAALITLLTSTSGKMARDTQLALRNAVSRTQTLPYPGMIPGLLPDSGHEGVPEMARVGPRVQTISVLTDADGSIIFTENRIFSIADEEVPDIVALALAGGEAQGQLHAYSLRYLVEASQDGQTVLAFADVSMEKEVVSGLLGSAALIGGMTLLLFFGIAILLSRWVVRPVEQAWNSQRQFVADASHELKTPLTVVLSNVEMLADDPSFVDVKTRSRLENILEEAKRMRTLVSDLLTLARSDIAGKTKSYEKVDLGAVVRNSLLMFETVYFDAGMRLDEQIEQGLYIRGDKNRLCQMVEILLDNAAKYTLPGGQITVRLSATGKGEVLLTVANESETIPKPELTSIFQRFYRLDKARSGGGYGLGLAIADSIVREHGGRIWAVSENMVTTFCVILPHGR
jgi:signal transduction histidine kinase